MPDILNDSTYPLPPIGNWEDEDNHTEAQQALTALNQLAFGERGAPGLTVRSVIEDGADVNAADNLAAFQATVDTLALAGGGIALVPAAAPGIFHLDGTLTIPANVILRGLGDRSIVRGNPVAGSPSIRFASGLHRGGVENLVLVGNEVSPRGTGIDLTGAHFLRLRNLQIWDFQLGIQMSDGFTSYAGHNHVSDFEVNRCHVGIRAWLHCNQASVLNGRIWRCRNNGEGTALDIQSADALAIAHVAVEHFDVGVRIRGRVHVSLRDVYYEADHPQEPFPPGIWMDIRPDKGSTVLMENSIANAKQSLVLGGSLEDAITNDERSSLSFGAKRHHAAAPERNLLENGDFHRAKGDTIPGWIPNFSPVLAENTNDFVTAGRSYDITQATNGNDGLTTVFTVPETTDYVTVMVRFKNVSSAEPLFGVRSGTKSGLFQDLLGPSDEWRVEAFTVEVDPAAAGVLVVTLTPDQSAAGGQIRVDEVWAVVGATAAPPRAHAHRFEILPDPLPVVTRSALKADAEFDPTDLTKLQGLARPPRGVVGAILSLRGTAIPAGLADATGTGATLPRAVRPFIQELWPDTKELVKGQRWSLDIIYDRLEHDRQVVLRGTMFKDGIKVFTGSMSTSYHVELVGWILPS